YLDGFCERFGHAAMTAETLFRAVGEHERCQILRSPAATNVAQLRVHGGNAAGLPQRLLASGISIRPALHSAADGALFELVTNETILRRPVAETIEIFLKALRSV